MISTRTSLAALMALVPAVQAHMALWHPSVYGFNSGDSLVYPLSGKSFNDWWFHGEINDKPKETMTLVPGQDLNLQIACTKSVTDWGRNPQSDACPNDAGSFHAGGNTGSASGWGGNNENNLLGCALAIAFKSNPYDVQPEDFTVMSVQERCVRQRDTTFTLPSNLPSCPEGGCTCAWFWAGKNSALEMYMTAFKCDVQGGSGTNYPTPVKPRKNQVNGKAVQPFYWANDRSNLDFTPEWATKPSYNSDWGFQNGAQTAAFGAGGGGGGGSGSGGNGNGSGSNSTSSRGSGGNGQGQETSAGGEGEWSPEPTSSRRRRPRPTGNGNGENQWNNGNNNNNGQDDPNTRFPVYAADPTGAADAGPTDVAQGEKGSGKGDSCLKKRKHKNKKRSRAHH